MALGLLTVHFLGLAVFAGASFGVFGSDELAAHIWAGLISVMLVVFAHTMSYFYLVAMTSVIRKALAGESGPAVLVDDPRGAALFAKSRALRSRTTPWALAGMGAPMVAFILGGGAHTRAFPPIVHAGAAWIVLAGCVAAAAVVGLALLRQNRIVEAFQLAAAETRP